MSNNADLDTLLNDIELSAHTDSIGNGAVDREDVRQAILDWHNKQIEEVLDRLSAEVKRAYDKEGDFLEMAADTIEAERNKLKEG